MSRRPCPNKSCACRDPSRLLGEPGDQPVTDVCRVGAVTSTNETESRQEDLGAASALEAQDNWADDRIRLEQTREPDIAFVRDLIESGAQKPTWDVIAPHSRTVKVLWSFWPRLVVQDLSLIHI